jgi:hypothetical protein
MTARPAAVVLVLVALAACNQATINTPIRSFDRPTDVALSCVRRSSQAVEVFDTLPLEDCRPDRQAALGIVSTDGLQYFPALRAIVTQTTRGEIAYATLDGRALVDLAPSLPGFGFLPVGELPEHVRTTPDGCWGATANAGSCDLSLIDLPVLANVRNIGIIRKGLTPDENGNVAIRLPSDSPLRNMTAYEQGLVRRLRISLPPALGGRTLLARPSWIELSPRSPKNLSGSAAGQPGVCRSPDNGLADAPKAWVALPGCELVVEVDLNGTIATVEQAIRVARDRTEVVSDLSTLSCPVECSEGQPAPADLGQPPDPPDGGAGPLPSNHGYPGALAVQEDAGGARLIIGDRTSDTLSIVPVDERGALGAPRRITLAENARGVDVVRTSPRTPAGQFLYAVARDGTVRVVDLDREVECETNPDPVALSSLPLEDPRAGARRRGCFPLGDPATPPRSPLATTPGIEFGNGALPRDVIFVHVDVPVPPSDPQVEPPAASPSLPVGDFAWVLTTDGRAQLVNVFDACPAPNRPQGVPGAYSPSCAASNAKPSRDAAKGFPGLPGPTEYELVSHRPRLGGSRYTQPTSCNDNAGAARVADETNPVNVTVSGVAQVDPARLPGIFKAARTDVPPGAQCPSATQAAGFLHYDRARPETWTAAWEGALPNTARATGRPLPGGSFVDTGGLFCSRGVLKGDKLVLRGCESDDDCDFAQVCARDPGAPIEVANGLCLDRDEDLRKLETEACGPLLRAVKRYRITRARQAPFGGLTEDTLDLAEIYQPEHPTDTRVCMAGDDCMDVTIPVTIAGETRQLPTTCLPDWDGQERCLRACDPAATTPQCSVGFICHPSSFGDPRCLRAPLDPRYFRTVGRDGVGCLRELQRYEIRSGDAFLVSGSSSGLLVEVQPDPVTGECGPPLVSSPYARMNQSRLPLDPAVECGLANEGAPGFIGSIVPPGDPSKNFCRQDFTSGEAKRYLHFENPFLAFTLVIPGVGNRFATPPENTELELRVLGTAFPLSVALAADIQAQSPRAGIAAPDGQTVFIVDEGKQTQATGLRGQLLRLSTSAVAVDRAFLVR